MTIFIFLSIFLYFSVQIATPKFYIFPKKSDLPQNQLLEVIDKVDC